jgi:cation diffusion facilitator CzcD-associated flavoprotein CzcO
MLWAACNAVRYGWFELPEFSWPAELRAAASDKQYPPGPTIQAYLHAYAKKFGLDRLVRTRTPVTQVQHQADGTWAVSYSSEGAAASRAVFSHLIVATGAYGRSFIPDVKVPVGDAAPQHPRCPLLNQSSI